MVGLWYQFTCYKTSYTGIRQSLANSEPLNPTSSNPLESVFIPNLVGRPLRILTLKLFFKNKRKKKGKILF
jgi:hypothetical protein